MTIAVTSLFSVMMVTIVIGSHAEGSSVAKIDPTNSLVNPEVVQFGTPIASGSGINPRTSSGLKGTVTYEGLPCPPPSGNSKPMPGCTGPLSGYEIVIYAEDGTSIIARTRTDDNGNYSVSLPPASYVIYTPAGPLPSMRVAHHVLIKENEIVTEDLTIDTGVR